MIRRPPRSTRTHTRCPYTTLFLSQGAGQFRLPDSWPWYCGRHVAWRHHVDGANAGANRIWHGDADAGLYAADARPAQFPEFRSDRALRCAGARCRRHPNPAPPDDGLPAGRSPRQSRRNRTRADRRTEEHTSELQSLMRISYAVFCLTKKNSTAEDGSRTVIMYTE